MIRVNKDKIKGRFLWIYKYKFSVYSFDLLNHLLTSDSELNEIYKLKHMYQDFNENSNIDNAKEYLLALIKKFRNHEIREIREYGRTLDRWKVEIINSFTKHDGIRYSNAKLESRNRQMCVYNRTCNSSGMYTHSVGLSNVLIFSPKIKGV